MSIVDFIILNFAIGAPFGVLYYFENRHRELKEILWIKSFMTSIVWLPFALKVLRSKLFKPHYNFDSLNPDSNHSSKKIQEIFKIQTEIEKFFSTSKSIVSIYEFRESAERYIGLTLANQNENSITFSKVLPNDYTNILDRKSIDVAEACTNRRNRRLLSYHQKIARNDFVAILTELMLDQPKHELLFPLLLNLSYQLDDMKLQKLVSARNKDHKQIFTDFAVARSENDLWKTDELLPAIEHHLLVNQQSIQANLISKD